MDKIHTRPQPAKDRESPQGSFKTAGSHTTKGTHRMPFGAKLNICVREPSIPNSNTLDFKETGNPKTAEKSKFEASRQNAASESSTYSEKSQHRHKNSNKHQKTKTQTDTKTLHLASISSTTTGDIHLLDTNSKTGSQHENNFWFYPNPNHQFSLCPNFSSTENTQVGDRFEQVANNRALGACCQNFSYKRKLEQSQNSSDKGELDPSGQDSSDQKEPSKSGGQDPSDCSNRDSLSQTLSEQGHTSSVRRG